MNADIEKMKFFETMKFDLKGHWRSYKMTFYFKIHLFFDLFLKI